MSCHLASSEAGVAHVHQHIVFGRHTYCSPCGENITLWREVLDAQVRLNMYRNLETGAVIVCSRAHVQLYVQAHTHTQIHVCGRRLRPDPKIGCVGTRTSPQRRGMMRWVSWAFSSLCFLAGQAMQSVRFISCCSLATTMTQLALWFLFTLTLCTYVVAIADIASWS